MRPKRLIERGLAINPNLAPRLEAQRLAESVDWRAGRGA